MDARQAQIVELRYYGGLTVEETVAGLGISPRTVKREWSSTRAWLQAQVRGVIDSFILLDSSACDVCRLASAPLRII